MSNLTIPDASLTKETDAITLVKMARDYISQRKHPYAPAISYLNEAIEILAKNETLPPMSGWVKVTDRLPESRQWVNICVEHDGKQHVAPGFGVILTHDNGRFRWESEFPVTHWQPLPAPPNEDK